MSHNRPFFARSPLSPAAGAVALSIAHNSALTGAFSVFHAGGGRALY